MTSHKLVKIEKVALRDARLHESAEFTPWLAENINELGEALGIDLEFQQTEVSVGRFSLDILASEIYTNRPVIIENQLGTTNHNHLGKLLTYVAGHNANIIIWLTEEFHDEHRQALDWLNQRTDEDTLFFGVVVELLRIGNSPLAPYFRMVAAPNGYQKRNRNSAQAPSAISAEGEINQQFRQTLDEKLRANGVIPWMTRNPEVPYRPLGGILPFVYYGAIWDRKQLNVDLLIATKDRSWNWQLYSMLQEQRTEIKLALMEFDREIEPMWLDARTKIRLCRDVDIYKNRDAWEEYQNWIIFWYLNFREVFDARIKELATYLAEAE